MRKSFFARNLKCKRAFVSHTTQEHVTGSEIAILTIWKLQIFEFKTWIFMISKVCDREFMALICAHGASRRLFVARLRLVNAQLGLRWQSWQVGVSETSQTFKQVNYAICDREFNEMSPDEWLIGLCAPSRWFCFKDTYFNLLVSNFQPNRSRAAEMRLFL